MELGQRVAAIVLVVADTSGVVGSAAAAEIAAAIVAAFCHWSSSNHPHSGNGNCCGYFSVRVNNPLFPSIAETTSSLTISPGRPSLPWNVGAGAGTAVDPCVPLMFQKPLSASCD